MKPKTMILMGLAITCGLGASFMTSRLLADRGEETKETVNVLIAKKYVGLGEIVKNGADLFEEKTYVKGEQQKGAIEVAEGQFKSAVDQLKGRTFKFQRKQGDQISLEDLYDKDSNGLQVPPGFRAIGLRVNMESIASGFAALPHTRVDIVCTIRRGSDRDTFSKILLENVLVLASDTKTVREENSQAMPANVVTVALSPEDSLKVAVAREVGSLSLVVRGHGDTKRSNIANVTMESIITNTRGSGDGTEDGTGDGSSSSGVASLPALPGSKNARPQVPVQIAEAKKHEKHILTVFEGAQERATEYAIDPVTKEVIRHEVIRSEVEATQPQGQPQAQPAPNSPRPNPAPVIPGPGVPVGPGTGSGAPRNPGAGGGWSGGNN